MDRAKAGADAIASKDFPTAATEYTLALLQHPTSPDYLIQRSTAFTRLSPPRHDLALKDAELSLLCARKRASRKYIQAAQLRRMISLYWNGRYAEAKYVYSLMKPYFPKDEGKDKGLASAMAGGEKKGVMEANIWLMKTEKKLKENPQEEVTGPEFPEGDVVEKQLLKLYNSQMKDGKFDLDWKVGQDEGAAAPVKKDEATSAVNNATASTGQAKIRHEWYQNQQSVIITVYAKGVPKDQADIDIQDESVSITFPQPSDPNATFHLSFDPLFALIDATGSISKIMSTKVELTLKKAVPGKKWASVEGTEPLKKDTNGTNGTSIIPTEILTGKPAQDKPPSYPTSSRTGPKNWDKLAQDFTKKPKSQSKSKKENEDDDSEPEEDDSMKVDDDDEFGGDAVDGFFKKLYKDADDDTRRAMMKSFSESNGTSLSTDWGSVKKGKVEEVKSEND